MLDECKASESHKTLDVDRVYGEFCAIIDYQLDTKHVSHQSRQVRKARWNTELTNQAKEVRIVLKAWKSSKGDQQDKHHLKAAYLQKQKDFSKMVRSSKRKFRRLRNKELLEKQKQDPGILLKT